MTYTTTLIIPFRFDCRTGRLADIDALVKKQGVWRSTTYSCPNAMPSVAALYNSGSRAGMYKASNQAVKAVTKHNKFLLQKGSESYHYSFGDLLLFLFDTGVGFLCPEVKCDTPAALRRLRTFNVKGVHPFIDHGQNNLEPFSLMTLMEKLLDFTPSELFFTSSNPHSFAQAGLLVYAFNDSGTPNNEVIDSIFTGAGEYVAKRVHEFQGSDWGISANCAALVIDPTCRNDSGNQYGSLRHNYLPLIVLALHAKAAACQFGEDIRTQSGSSDRLREEIAAFLERYLPENVSSAPIKQQVYSEVKRLNPPETAPLTSFLAKDTTGSNVKDKLLGAISLIFSVGSIFSILSDGINVIQEVVPESMKQIARYGMYALCIALAVLGIYGVYLIFKPKKK